MTGNEPPRDPHQDKRGVQPGKTRLVSDTAVRRIVISLHIVAMVMRTLPKMLAVLAVLVGLLWLMARMTGSWWLPALSGLICSLGWWLERRVNEMEQEEGASVPGDPEGQG